jgi:hypothetical protein
MPKTPEPDPINRLRRGLEIRAARAAGETWASIGRRYGISDRQARRSAKAAAEVVEVVGVFDTHDAQALLARILAVQVTALDRLEALLASEPAENAVIGATRAVATLGDSAWSMLVRLGVVPSDGRKFAIDKEVQAASEALLQAASDCGIDPEVVRHRLAEETPLAGALEAVA